MVAKLGFLAEGDKHPYRPQHNINRGERARVGGWNELGPPRNQRQVHSPRRGEEIAIRPIDGEIQHGKRASVTAPLVIYGGA
jgi:hypothetical protein